MPYSVFSRELGVTESRKIYFEMLWLNSINCDPLVSPIATLTSYTLQLHPHDPKYADCGHNERENQWVAAPDVSDGRPDDQVRGNLQGTTDHDEEVWVNTGEGKGEKIELSYKSWHVTTILIIK